MTQTLTRTGRRSRRVGSSTTSPVNGFTFSGKSFGPIGPSMGSGVLVNVGSGVAVGSLDTVATDVSFAPSASVSGAIAVSVCAA